MGTSSQRHQLNSLVSLYCKWGGSGTPAVAPRSGPWAANIQVKVPVHLAGGDTDVQVGESLPMLLSMSGEISLEESLEESEGLNELGKLEG